MPSNLKNAFQQLKLGTKVSAIKHVLVHFLENRKELKVN